MLNKISKIFSKDYDWEMKVYLLLLLATIGPAIMLYTISKLALLAVITLMVIITINPTKTDAEFAVLIGLTVLASIFTMKSII